MLVMGVDPGTRRANPTGICIMDDRENILYLGEVKPHAWSKEWMARIPDIGDTIMEIAREWSADLGLISFEAPIMQVGRGANPESIAPMWALVGMVLGIGRTLACPVVRVQPNEAKLALAGNARADKDDMIAVARLLVKETVSSHQADAIGIARAGRAKWEALRILSKIEMEDRKGREKLNLWKPPMPFQKDVHV